MRHPAQASPTEPTFCLVPTACTRSCLCSLSCLPLPFPQEFVSGIDGIPEGAKQELLQLTPGTYVGNAAQQAKDIRKHLAAL